MKEAQCKCSCQEESEDQILAKISRFAKDNIEEGSLIQVLHFAQELYGHLPMKVQELVAKEMGLPLAQVSGVVSFYSFFTPSPRGKHTIRVCLGTACYVRGGKKIVEELSKRLAVKVGETTKDQLFTLEVARCIGACGLAPALSIDDVVYKQVAPDKLDLILDRYQVQEVTANA